MKEESVESNWTSVSDQQKVKSYQLSKATDRAVTVLVTRDKMELTSSDRLRSFSIPPRSKLQSSTEKVMVFNNRINRQ